MRFFNKKKIDIEMPKDKIDVINGNVMAIDTLYQRMKQIEDRTVAMMKQVLETAGDVLRFQQEFQELAELVDKQIETVKTPEQKTN